MRLNGVRRKRAVIGTDPTFSVSEFVAVFNQSLDMIYPSVGIMGELANFKISKGRWVYFDLKDEDASVRFFGNVQQLPGPLENGLNLEVFGHPRLHPQYGFSVNIANIQVVGKGSLARAQTMLAKKLETEGLFSPVRKRPLPYPPVNIGLITSVESAAYADFIKITNQRWGNVNIQLMDCLVQGVEAPSQIVNAIEYFNQQASPPEVLVLIRGGGSPDDLAAFSTEQVVRAVATSRITTLVAIGHETDISLAEMAADRQASTPSNAAELLLPDADHEKVNLSNLKKHMLRTLQTIHADKQQQTSEISARLEMLLNNIIIQNEQGLQQRRMLLKALDPKAPLGRGFALVRDSRGKLIRTVSSARKAADLSIDLADGQINAKVVEEGK